MKCESHFINSSFGKTYIMAIGSASADKKSQLTQVLCQANASPILVSWAVRNTVKEREIHFLKKTDSTGTMRM